jgi:tetratricopeptide (TPR) repeat protein
VAGALAAVWPYLLYGETVVVGIEVSVFLNALALFALARFAERPGAGRAIAAGVVLGLGALARPNLLLFAVLLPAWFAAAAPAGDRLRATARWSALVAAGVLVPLLPVLVRNLAVSGEPVLTTTSMGANLWISNNPCAWKTGVMGAREVRFAPHLIEGDSRAAAQAEEGRSLSPTEVSAHWTCRTLRVAVEEPASAGLFLVRKLLCFFDGAEVPSSDLFPAAREEARALHWIPLGFGFLSAFALLGAGIVVLRRREALPLAMLFAAYAAALVLFFPLAHYRAPVLPAAFGLASLGALSLLDAVQARDRVLAVRLVATLAAAGLLAGGARLAAAAGVPSLGTMGQPAFGRGLLKADILIVSAKKLRSEGRTEEASRVLDAAVRYVRSVMAGGTAGEPELWSAEFALANLAAARGDLKGEAAHLESAVALRPGDGRLRAKLAWNLNARGLARRATAEAERAAADAPDDPFARATFGRMLLASGAPARALGEFEAAGRAGPPHWELMDREAECLRALARPAEALSRLDLALQRWPDIPALLIDKARTIIALPGGDRAAAAAAIRRAQVLGVPIPADLNHLTVGRDLP